MSRHAKLYNDQKWKHPVHGVRIRKLRTDPLCWYCEQLGRVTAADTVDHIIPHRGDVRLFYEWGNLRSACRHCHDSAAKLKDKHGHVPGVDVNGIPIDPGHPWLKG